MIAKFATIRAAIMTAYPLILIALAWELVARLGYIRPAFLPPLSVIFGSLVEQLRTGDLVGPLAVSLYRAAIGTGIALAGGVTVGFLMARVRMINWILGPLIALGFPAPKIAFVPIFILWFGIGHSSKIALVVFTCLFPFIIAGQAGALSVPRAQLWAAAAMGTSPIRMVWSVVLPASLPSLMSGVRVAVPYALITTFTTEMIAGGGGLGGELVYAQRYFDTTTVFAILIIMLATGYGIDHLILKLRARVLRWHAAGAA